MTGTACTTAVERDASITVFDFDDASGAITQLQRIGSLPAAFGSAPWAAEIRIAPDGRHPVHQ